MTDSQRKLKLSPHSSNDIDQVPEGNIKRMKKIKERKSRNFKISNHLEYKHYFPK